MKQASDRAMHEEKQAQAELDSLRSRLQNAEIALRFAQVALAGAVAASLFGVIATIGLTSVVAAAQVAVSGLRTKVTNAETRISQATFKRDQAISSYDLARTEKRQAQTYLDGQKRILETNKDQWKRQIEVKNAAKQEVDQQTQIVQKSTSNLTESERLLAVAKEQRTTKTNEFHEDQAQVQKQSIQCGQLKIELDDLRKRQTLAQQAFVNAENALTKAQTRFQKANANLRSFNEELNNKQRSVRQTEVSRAQKQTHTQKNKSNMLPNKKLHNKSK
ncbi:unnamed protein product [Sphagnum troendelagicum]|uniref:Uncharacterized protein n=1 Tax=Sphagnum troendelagicum TaxID=128251 RepID=A0ABP0T6K9_9BRYO